MMKAKSWIAVAGTFVVASGLLGGVAGATDPAFGGGAAPLLCDGAAVTVSLGAGQSPTIGDDVIMGTDGDDVIVWTGGNDTICGGAGSDTVSYVNSPGKINAVLRDFGHAGVAARYAGKKAVGNDWLLSVENMLGSTYDDLLRGNDDANRLEGGDGDDKIWGKDGSDDLFGGTRDRVAVATVRDKVWGGDGVDSCEAMDRQARDCE